MRMIRTLLIPAAAFALALAAAPAADNHQQHVHDAVAPHNVSHDGDSAHTCTQTHSTSHTLRHSEHVDHIDAALTDMHHFAAGHFGAVHERPETFGQAVEWAPDWELRWIDFETPQRVVRIYHATSRHDHQIRFVARWDHHNGHYNHWQKAF